MVTGLLKRRELSSMHDIRVEDIHVVVLEKPEA